MCNNLNHVLLDWDGIVNKYFDLNFI